MNRIYLSAGGMALALITLAAPVPLALAEGETERDAVLLECCNLPDKKLILTETDLDGIVSRFTPDTPIKLQHMDSPLDPFGTVQRIWRDGKRLLGTLSFPSAIAALVRERGAAALSCGLDRSPLSLAEVSLVIKGRLPAACLLSEDDASELLRLRIDNAQYLLSDAAQKTALTVQKVDAQVVTLKLAGKIIPATEAAARVLLMAGDTSKITLADGTALNVSEAFATYLAAQPALVTLGELATLAAQSAQSSTATEDQTLDDDARAWLEKSLGVKADDVAKMMQTGAGKMGAVGSLAGRSSFPTLAQKAA